MPAFLGGQYYSPMGRYSKPPLEVVVVTYCADNGRQPLGKKRFFGTMRAKGYYGSKSNGIWYFSGISLKESEFEPADDEDHPFR